MEEQQEILEIFDRHNRRIGQATRGTIHRLGLRHRSVHIFVFDDAGRLYLQLRRENKDLFPRHWDTSAAGHVSPGEDYAAAAARELAEELGIQEKLEFLAEVTACPQTGWEHVVLFRCRTAKEPTPNPEEIETGAFYTLEEIEQMLANPDWPITPAFHLLYRLWRGEPGAEEVTALPAY